MQAAVIQKEVLLGGQWSGVAQLAEVCELSRDEIAQAASKGAVWLAKPGKKSKLRRVREIDTQAKAGDTLYINYNPQVLEQAPVLPTLISDQGNYSVWHKPAGVLSQGSKWSDHCTITETAASVHNKKCMLVHRLDRAAAGLMVLAHTPNACRALASLFQVRKVEKIYECIVHGRFEQALPCDIQTPLDNKPTHTIVHKVQPLKELSHLTLEIKTGRKHQIRKHLSSMGFPVVGDRLYDPERSHQHDLQLVATELKFICPFSEKALHVQLNQSLRKQSLSAS